MTSAQIGFAGRMVLALETPPWDSGYRMLIGYGVMPAYLQLAGANRAPWKLFVFFLAVWWRCESCPVCFGGCSRFRAK